MAVGLSLIIILWTLCDHHRGNQVKNLIYIYIYIYILWSFCSNQPMLPVQHAHFIAAGTFNMPTSYQ